LVKIGYGGPRIARGLHPSGYTDNLIHNVGELSILNKDKDAVRIAHTVGIKKRLDIISKAESLGLKILNGKKREQKISSPDKVKSKEEK
jgi:large subunit ribosomal protein L32e